ncbi:MAG: hypothetical protein LBL45_07215 [Treponema sp.]|nr:hypothetical protein [Treponema sp.]
MLLNKESAATTIATKADAKAMVDAPSQTVAVNAGQSKAIIVMATTENGNKTYTATVAREAPVFYDNA